MAKPLLGPTATHAVCLFEVLGSDGELQSCEISAESALDAVEHPHLYLAVATPSHH